MMPLGLKIIRITRRSGMSTMRQTPHGPQDLQKNGEDRCADDRAGDGADPSQVDHDQNVRRLENIEHARIDVLKQMREERSRNAGEEGRNDEGDQLDVARVHAHEIARDLILAYGKDAPAEVRIDEIADDPDRKNRPEEDPGEGGQFLHSEKAAGPAHGFQVFDERFDDHVESERDDGQIIAAGLERRNGDHQSHESRHESSCEDREGEKQKGRAAGKNADR